MSKRQSRKKARSPSPLRVRRSRFQLHGLGWDFTTPSPLSNFGVSCLGNASHDVCGWEVRFDPPLEKLYASCSSLSILHLESMRRDCFLTILPHTEDKRLTAECYMEFPTHVVKFADTTVSSVETLYLILENNQLNGKTSTPILEPHFNWGLGFLPRLFDYKALSFFPPSTDRKALVDLSKIPQSSPITHKPAGGTTSSRVPKILKYYGEDEPGEFTGFRAAAVRFGRLSEVKALITYLNAHPKAVFSEVGFLSTQNAGILDGCQPDGILLEESLTLLVEFKCSRSNCLFDGAHMAQCIWEMASGYPAIDLVRYCERQMRNSEGLWTTGYQCKEIRIWRNEDMEKELIRLDRENKLGTVKEEDLKTMRDKLDALAAEANNAATELSVPMDLLKQLEDYRRDTLASQAQDDVTIHPVLDRIEKRQALIFAGVQEGRSVAKEVGEQIREYTELL